ncbi:MAG: hypothetical protein AB7G13_28770 [Lautropia sp.]
MNAFDWRRPPPISRPRKSIKPGESKYGFHRLQVGQHVTIGCEAHMAKQVKSRIDTLLRHRARRHPERFKSSKTQLGVRVARVL